MDSIGYNMVFDTNNVEYKTVTEKVEVTSK